MKPLRVAVTIAVLAWPLTSPVRAQSPMMPSISLQGDQPSKTPEQIEQEQARDKAYKESLKKIPEAKSADPWGGVRSDAAKPSASPKTSTTAKKTKTGSNAN
jgi:hypothetical protein